MSKNYKIRWLLVLYDFLVLAATFGLFVAYDFYYYSTALISHVFLALGTIFGCRFFFGIYGLIWRYGGIQSFLKLIISDGIAYVIYYVFQRICFEKPIDFIHSFALFSVNLLLALSMRMFYRYAYKCGGQGTPLDKTLSFALKVATMDSVKPHDGSRAKKINIAIIGAGSLGVNLAEELKSNPTSTYNPRLFIDDDTKKVGKQIIDIPIMSSGTKTLAAFDDYDITEVVIAISSLDGDKRKELYDYYTKTGCKVKVYDYPTMENAGEKKRRLREFDTEELLFRKQLDVVDQRTYHYYFDKTVLITGGGGSIGSELCRQIAKMSPKKIIILDVYENGAYDVQQELRIAYNNKVDIRVEIVSVCNRVGLERVFSEYRPQVVLNAAAHKHVPLMEKNCIEAVENNIFGTLNTVELSEKYGVERVMMVSTDKAVNPTNVMGATKRFCEMIVQSHALKAEKTTFSITRFGNVLGSAGSVIPLFKKQIANGGPVTITDKRIIRYFMTIPEASQLVLTSGAMAKNGELFVLDMGNPVKIIDLAENMIRLSGLEPDVDIPIIETGLRPGEKLYEELLIKTEELDKTENSLIFIERDTGIPEEELNSKLDILREAVSTNDDSKVRDALRSVVPTFRTPEEVNKEAENANEMQAAK